MLLCKKQYWDSFARFRAPHEAEICIRLSFHALYDSLVSPPTPLLPDPFHLFRPRVGPSSSPA